MISQDGFLDEDYSKTCLEALWIVVKMCYFPTDLSRKTVEN